MPHMSVSSKLFKGLCLSYTFWLCFVDFIVLFSQLGKWYILVKNSENKKDEENITHNAPEINTSNIDILIPDICKM